MAESEAKDWVLISVEDLHRRAKVSVSGKKSKNG